MMRRLFIVSFLLFAQLAFSQTNLLKFSVFDSKTKLPVKDAHVFIGNATFGTISNEGGEVRLRKPVDITSELIISHVAYDLLVLQYSGYSTLSALDSIFLTPNGVNIEEVLIKSNRGLSWKKNYRKFKKAFIGSRKEARLTEIHNPEVLRFENVDGVFKATAVDMLRITNFKLGYDIDFILKELTIDKDGSMKYHGYPKFTDVTHIENQKEVEKNRQENYKKSMRHFFKNLISDNLQDAKYKIKSKSYDAGKFEEISTLKASDIVFLDTLSGLYHVRFEEFLEVTHLGFKEVVGSNFNVRSGGLESSKFSNIQGGERTRINYPVSMLYKTSPSLIINNYGNIVNQRQVQEYGYWAGQRVGSLLPFDYGFSYKEETVTDNTKAKTTTKSLVKGILYGDLKTAKNILQYMSDNWDVSYAPMLLDLLRVIGVSSLSTEISGLLFSNIEILDYYTGLYWMWEGEPVFDDFYADTKAEIYKQLDPKFEQYFQGRIDMTTISLDEIVWGGVKQDGIPPLRYPKMVSANEVLDMKGTDVVFGLYVNGEAKAYPKKILAWHEFFIDSIGGEDISGVYCTLCGSMIAYNSSHKGNHYKLGTSGFLYRSNKLMYDQETQSLWSTLDGEPVVGPLINKGIKLRTHPIVTTTWADWLAEHPNTRILSKMTGYKRSYIEGAAYKDYFATDDLMFPVPLDSYKMSKKAEVLIIRSDRYEHDPLAISIDFLKRKRMYKNKIADKNIIVLQSPNKIHKAYYTRNTNFKSYKNGVLKDESNAVWKVTEDYLEGPKGKKYDRLPSHRSFWFAWYNLYPKTRLVD